MKGILSLFQSPVEHFWLEPQHLASSLTAKSHLSASAAWAALRGAMQMTGRERADLILRFILIKSDLLCLPLPTREA